MRILKQLSMAALLVGMIAIAMPALAGHGKGGGYGPGDGTGGRTRPQDGTGNGAKKGTCPRISAADDATLLLIAGRGKGGGYGPGDGTGGTRPQDGTGNGAKKGSCTTS